MRDAPPMKDPVRTARPSRRTTIPLPQEEPFDAATSLLRLVIGGLLEGADELRVRMRDWEDLSRATIYASRLASKPQPPALRHTLVGMAFEAESRMRRSVTRAVGRMTRAADDADHLYTRVTRSMRGTPLDPVGARLDRARWRVRTLMDSWTERGIEEEQLGRRMAERAAASMIDELLDYMARDPALRQLMEHESMGIVEDAAQDVRQHVVATDLWLERFARQLLHRRMAASAGATPATADNAAPPSAIRSTRRGG